MKSILLFLVCIFFLQVAASCNDDHRQNILLQKADSLMFISPETSLSILGQVDATILSPDERALHALLLSQAKYRNYIDVDNDSLIKIALDYYRDSSDSLNKARTYMYASCIYDELGDKPLSLSYIQKAAKSAEFLPDCKLKGYIYYYWGRLLILEQPYEESVNYMLKSANIAKQENDISLAVARLGETGWIYMCNHNFKKAEAYLDSAIKLGLSHQSYGRLAYLYGSKAVIEYNNANYKKALNFSRKAIPFFKYDPDSLTGIELIGRIMIELNQLDSAEYYINKGKRNNTFYEQANHEVLMSRLEAKRGNFEKALEHRITYSDLLDSINAEENRNRVMQLQKRYDFKQMEAERDALEIANQRKTILLLAIVIAVLVLGTIVFMRVAYLQKKTQATIAAKDRMISQAALRVQRKTTEMLEMQQRESALKERIFQMDDIVRKIESLKAGNDGKTSVSPKAATLSKEEQEGLIAAVNFCYDGFADRLQGKFLCLTHNDICLCCLIRMGVATQNIALLLGISESALRKRKSRLKNDKFGNDTEEPLEAFLNRL